MLEDRVHRLADARELRVVMLLLGRQEGARAPRLVQAATDEHLRQRPAYAELALQAGDRLARARRDLKSWLLHRRPHYGQRATEPRGGPVSGRVARGSAQASVEAWASARSRRMPSRYTTAIPISAPGIAYSTTPTFVAF